MYSTVDNQEIHIVSAGESCKKIGKKYNVKVEDLLKYNLLSRHHEAIEGQHLLIPRSKYYEKIHILAILRKHFEKIGCKKLLMIIVNIRDKRCPMIVTTAVLIASEEKISSRCDMYSLDKNIYIHEAKLDVKYKHFNLYDIKTCENLFSKDISISCCADGDSYTEARSYFDNLYKCTKRGKIYASRDGMVYEQTLEEHIVDFYPHMNSSLCKHKSDGKFVIVTILIINLLKLCESSEEASTISTVTSCKSTESIYDRRTPNIPCPFTIKQIQLGKFGDSEECSEGSFMSSDFGYTSESFECFEVICDETSSSCSSSVGKSYNHRRYPHRKMPLRGKVCSYKPLVHSY